MSDVVWAAVLGALSASPLALGALTARVWKPTDFVLGLLTAFGAGALLSAVTIDIVAHSVEVGDVRWLAAGAVVGGVVFEMLNRLVNSRGGFLRKASTAITFLRDREQRRRRAVLDDLERIDVFDGLPDRELDAIARAFRTERLEPGEALYRHGDPCEHINVLERGELTLRFPHEDDVSIRPHQAFGHLAFVSGTHHHSAAIAAAECEVLRLSRTRLRSVLRECPEFAARLRARVEAPATSAYLRDHHPDIGDHEIERWRAVIAELGIEELPELRDLSPAEPESELVSHLSELAVFRGLPTDTLVRIADRMFLEEHDPGFVLFRPGLTSQRCYVVADGDIALIDASGDSDDCTLLLPGDGCGLSSFLTGMRHTATAITESTADVHVLRRSDLDELLAADPALRTAVAGYLSGPTIQRYLTGDHELSDEAATALVKRATTAVRRGSMPPLVAAGTAVAAAPLAIWLGLFLDGVPESLVIGATAGAVRVSFLVGIALSNYPESLASSVGMHERGLGWRNIGVLWGVVIAVTALGAGIGSLLFREASPELFALMEGVAAGAMLTVITQTMMPEALHRAGGLVGLSALGGFLVTTLAGA